MLAIIKLVGTGAADEIVEAAAHGIGPPKKIMADPSVH
jgi:hypothetical protein